MPAIGAAIGAIASGIGGVLAGGGIGAALLRMGGSILLSAIAQKGMGRRAGSGGVTSRTVTMRAAAEPRPIVYGRTRMGGTIFFLHSGSDSDYDITFLPRDDLTAAEVAASGVALRVSRVIRLASGDYVAIARGGAYPAGALVDATTMQPIEPPSGYGPAVVVAGGTNAAGLDIFVLPRAGVPGGVVSNQQLYLNIALATHRVKSIGAIYFDGELAVDAAGVVQPRWAGLLRVEKALGDADQSAFPLLREDLPSMWTDQHRARGVACVSLRLAFDTNAYPSGIPNITFDIEGKDDILDPRTGLRGYTTNAALCVADYMSLPAIMSIAAPIGAVDGIDVDDLIEAANICDEQVAMPGGGTEVRYSCNGVIRLDQSPQTIIQGLLTAMSGRAAWQGGIWRIRAGAWRIPVTTLTVDDARGGLTLQTRVSRAENCNGIRGTFISPDTDWQPDDFPAIASDVYLAEDGGERKFRDIALPFTISPSMAQRLAKIELEKVRRQQSIAWPGMLSAWRATVSDVVQVDYARWGFAAKPFEVTGVATQIIEAEGGRAPLLVPDLVLRETSPLVYDWSATEAQIYAAAPRTTLPGAFDLGAPEGLAAAEALYITRDGTQVKARVLLEWTAPPQPYVAQYQIEARLQGATVWQSQGRTTDRFFDLLDWTPGAWEFRVAAVSILGVFSPWVSITAEIFGLGAPPQALADVTIQTAGGIAILKWTRPSDPDVRIGGNIVIRHSDATSPTWQNSYSMDRVNGNEAIAIVPLKPGTYMLRAEDSTGQLGPVAMVTTKGAQVVPFIPVQSLTAEPSFAGTRVRTAVVAGQLVLTGAAGAPPAGSPFEAIDFTGGVAATGTLDMAAGMDFGAVKRVRLRSEIGMSAINVFDLWDSRVGSIDSWGDIDGSAEAEVDVLVEYRETDSLVAPVTWSAWSRLDASEIEARAVQVRATLISNDAAFTVAVSKLRIHADEVA